MEDNNHPEMANERGAYLDLAYRSGYEPLWLAVESGSFNPPGQAIKIRQVTGHLLVNALGVGQVATSVTTAMKITSLPLKPRSWLLDPAAALAAINYHRKQCMWPSA